MEKRRCTNCGAYLDENEKVCYVCGEVQIPEVVGVNSENDNDRPHQRAINFEQDDDFVVPAHNHGDDTRIDFEDRLPYEEEDIAEPYYKNDEKRESFRRRQNKKTAIIAVICVLAVAIVGAVCFCLVNGVFDSKKAADGKITIYFDKPQSDVDLITAAGVTYNWFDDVEVSYVLNDKEKTAACSPCGDHDTLWKITLDENATSIYFYESGEQGMRTQVLPSFENETVYYVSQNKFNLQNQLPLGMCERESFEGIGINYATSAETSEQTTAPQEESTTAEKKTAETDEFPTEDDDSEEVDNGTYTVNLPKSWRSGVTTEEDENCTTFYEEYNYKNYNMGKLASVYVFDADDDSADNLSGVKDIRYNSDQTKKIVITTPTDVQFDDSDEKSQEKYLEKNKDLARFLDSISVE